jgi:hypothetical protein
MREDLGLAKLLLLIQEYAEQQGRPKTETLKSSQYNQNQAPM